MGSLLLQSGSITDIEADAIVNAANSGLQAGGGVCGAIFAAAGYEELQAACNAIGRCETGDAVITPGFRSKAQYIIHAVGPVWFGGGHGEAEALGSCYRRSITLALDHACTKLVFPLISAGIYGYPKEEAWRIALTACMEYLSGNQDSNLEIVFAIPDRATLEQGKEILHGMLREGLPQDELDLNDGSEAFQRGDYEDAFCLFRKSASEGNVTALSCLGGCYEEGLGVPKDAEKAAVCWEKAAEGGDVNASWRLGDLYRNGDIGEKKDLPLAKRLYAQAFQHACENYSVWSFPDASLRMLQFCREWLREDELESLVRETVDAFRERVKMGDDPARQGLLEARRIQKEIAHSSR